MKIAFYYLSCLLLLTLMSCGPDSPSECQDFCEMGSIEVSAFSNGECMSLCATCSNVKKNNGKLANCVCNYFEVLIDAGEGTWEDIGIKNRGECIKAIKDGGDIFDDGDVVVIGS